TLTIPRPILSPPRPPPTSPPSPYTTLFRSTLPSHLHRNRSCQLPRRTRSPRLRPWAKPDGQSQPGHPSHQTPPQPRRGLKRLARSEEHTSELQSRFDLVCRLLLEKKKKSQG